MGIGGPCVGVSGRARSSIEHCTYCYGTNAAGDELGNIGNGVLIQQGASGNEVGDVAASEGNVIAFNRQAGVAVNDPGSVGNSIRGNAIHDNGGLGIDLAGGVED